MAHVKPEAEPRVARTGGRPKGSRTKRFGSYAQLRKEYLVVKKRFTVLDRKMRAATKANETLQKALMR